MRQPSKVLSGFAAFAIALAIGATAQAAPMDPEPARLGQPNGKLPAGTTCATQTGGPGYVTCSPNNTSWSNLMSELGYALAPSAFHPARTNGYGGFTLTIEANLAHINANATDSTGTQYWHAGTQGQVNPTTHAFSGVNNNPDSILQVYSLKARKGLPLGFELTGVLGYVGNTTLWLGGADLHWALFEGFRTGFLGYLPDVSIGGGVRTIGGGASSLFLTTVGADAQISKPFTLGDTGVVLTPFVGGQRLWIFADSTVVNVTPSVNPLAQCGYQGTNVPGNPAAGSTGVGGSFNGQPICSTGNSAAFNSLATFRKETILRWRGIAGLTVKYEILYLAGEFAMDLEDPSAENAYLGVSGSRQWNLAFEAGVSF